MAGALSSVHQPFSGLRPVRHRRDLAEIADLIEVCFAGTLDAGGRAALREMRLISRTGPFLWALGRTTGGIPEARGFVWEDNGRVVGNVTIVPTGYERGYMIANVAVYPDYRRRGIARKLTRAAMVWIARHGRFAVLQVDADNDAARTLYKSLGFEALRTFTRWRRPPMRAPGGAATGTIPLRRLRRHESSALYALAQIVRPNARGGMGWLRPTRANTLRPARLGFLALVLGGKRIDFWVMPDANDSLAAAVRAEKRFGGLTTVFDALVQPDLQEHIEPALVGEVIRRFGGRLSPLLTDHPADDDAMSAALGQYGFRPERMLTHMIWPVDPAITTGGKEQ